jgi:hypothetical protein
MLPFIDKNKVGYNKQNSGRKLEEKMGRKKDTIISQAIVVWKNGDVDASRDCNECCGSGCPIPTHDLKLGSKGDGYREIKKRHNKPHYGSLGIRVDKKGAYSLADGDAKRLIDERDSEETED